MSGEVEHAEAGAFVADPGALGRGCGKEGEPREIAEELISQQFGEEHQDHHLRVRFGDGGPVHFSHGMQPCFARAEAPLRTVRKGAHLLSLEHDADFVPRVHVELHPSHVRVRVRRRLQRPAVGHFPFVSQAMRPVSRTDPSRHVHPRRPPHNPMVQESAPAVQ